MHTSQGFNLSDSDIEKMESALRSKMIRQSKIKIAIKDQNQKHRTRRLFNKRPEGVGAR